MTYPEAVDRFVEKLNKADTVYVIQDEELILEDGVFEGELAHDNVKNESVMVFTGPKMSGERIENFFLSIPSNAPWKRVIKVFSDTPKVYVTYESEGDQVEAEDINLVQESIVNTQAEVERYKAANDQAVEGINVRLTIAENNKAERTYVDTELLKKADKVTTYTKTETDDRIQAIIGAAPEALDTLEKIADALNNDPDFAATITNELATKVDKVAGKGLSTEDYTTTEKTKLAGIEAEANKYIHPASHPASMITESTSQRFVSDIEKAAWNAKETPAGAQAKADIAETNAKSYTDEHDQNTTKHITATERTNWNDANAKKHTHSNKSILDTITQTLINTWNSAVDHISDAVKHITSAERASWNAKQDALGYTPVNKAGDSMTGSLAVEHTTFPVVDITRNTSSTGGNVYGGARMVRKTTNPANGVGIGFYFQAPNSSKVMTHAGMFGGALGTIAAGSEKGEIVFGPSYAGQDPYTRRDLVIRAISASKAEAELNGKLRTDQTEASDSADTVATKKYVDTNIPTKVSQLENDAEYVTQIELETYKSVNDQAVDDLDSRLTTVENNKAEKSYVDSELSKKADKTYVDTELEKKANKSDTYTKSETNSLIQALIDSAPETLNTLAKIANAINNDPNFATTINTLLAQLEANKLDKSLKGVAGGLAELDSTGHVPSSQLPSYVDDVLEYPSKNNFPDVGETGKIYITLDTNLTYRWSGSTYVEISPSLALGETSSTAYRGDRGKIAYDHSLTIGNPHQTTKADIGLGNVENYGIATQAEAGAGSVNNKYMTPLRTKQAIDVLQAVKSVAGKTGNVTLTKDDVGLSNVDNVKQASKTEFDSHNNDTTRHITTEERTRWNAKQDALGYTPVNKAGDTMTGTLVIDGKNLPSGADIVTMRRGSETNRFVLETQDKGMQAFLEAGASIGLMGTITASDFRIRTNYLDRMSVSGSSGNVGIGTTSPSQKLDVNGKIRMRLQTQASDADDIVATKKYVDTNIPTKVSQLENDRGYVTQEELGDAGYGDMLKSIYDTDNDGKVDAAKAADSVPWTGVTGKPGTFPPSSHNHDERYIRNTGGTIQNGDLYMDGGSVNYIRPVTTGGWARGFWWSKRDLTKIGGIGVLGDGETISKFYIGYGTGPWSNSIVEIYPSYINVNGEIKQQGQTVLLKGQPLTWNDLKGV